VKGEWWLEPTTLRSDAAGQVRLSGWLGAYEIASAVDASSGRVDVGQAGDVAVEVRLG
jgi:hypothetical protein